MTAYITGVGIHPFGRFDDMTATQMGASAARTALVDADLWTPGEPTAIGGVFCGTAYGGVAAGHRVMGALGMTGMPIIDVEAGCASGGAALALARTAIDSGQMDHALVVGLEKMPKGIIRSSFFAPWQETGGLTPAPAFFALRAQRLLRDSGLTTAHLAAVVVKNRANGVANPHAMFRTAVTAEEVLASRVICEPLHLWMLCSPNEGAAAVVVSRSRTDRAIEIAGISLRSHLPGNILGEDSPLCGIDETGITPPSTLAAHDAYEQAGLGPDDLDLVECQDTDAARELLAWAELGLCGAGDQAQLLEEGATELTGRLPVNPSGGLLSKGEPLGASAVGQVVEICHHLRHEAGERQIVGARIGLAHVIGRGANACVTILRA